MPEGDAILTGKLFKKTVRFCGFTAPSYYPPLPQKQRTELKELTNKLKRLNTLFRKSTQFKLNSRLNSKR